jgi:competence ComEA-like helix-hairpin-helix protein
MKMLAALVILTIAQFLCHAATPDDQSLPDGPGKAIVQRMCVGCHSLKVVTSKRATHDQWNDLVQLMVSRGADGTDEDIESVINYLSAHFGPNNTKTEASSSSAAQSSDRPASSNSNEMPASKPEKPEKAEPPAPAPAAAANAPVNVNTASAQELETSLGLTEKEARGVIQYREQNGKFKNWQTVATIPGVPVGKIEDNRKRITF